MKIKNGKKTPYARFMLWLARKLIYKPRTIEREVDEGDEPIVYVANHSADAGVMYMGLYFDRPFRPWATHCIIEEGITPNYIFHDFFFGRQYKTKWPCRLLSRIVTVMLRPLIIAQNPIWVYRTDSRIMTTYKESIATLKDGQNITIFAESPIKKGRFVNKLNEGIVDLGMFAYKALGRDIAYCPVYIPAGGLDVIKVGTPIHFDHTAPIAAERQRITQYLEDSIESMGASLPEHKVVNFLAPTYYQYYAEFEHDNMAYWKFLEQKKSD